MAINTIVSTDTITVLGPPSNIELQLDIGPEGQRGSLFFSGVGDPNVLNFADPIQLGDLFVRTDQFGGSYGTIYKFNSVPSGNIWQELIAFQPISFNKVFNVDFIDGVGQFSILLNNFYINAPANLTADEVSVQLTPKHSFPVAISVSNKVFTSGANRSLVVEVTGASFDGNDWALLFEDIDILTTISIL